jgi:hypothetical protein
MRHDGKTLITGRLSLLTYIQTPTLLNITITNSLLLLLLTILLSLLGGNRGNGGHGGGHFLRLTFVWSRNGHTCLTHLL